MGNSRSKKESPTSTERDTNEPAPESTDTSTDRRDETLEPSGSTGASSARRVVKRQTGSDSFQTFLDTRRKPTIFDSESSSEDQDDRVASTENRQTKIPLQRTIVLKKQKDSALVCAAIDFGTSNSGYAYSFLNSPKNIFTNYWDGPDVKTPTVVLMNPCGKFHSFGNQARRDYEKLMADGEHSRWYLFERFKMKLFVQEVPLHKDVEIEDILGKKMKAITVFTEAIRYIKSHLLGVLKAREQLMDSPSVKEDEIHWLLTVPAIWNDLSKRFMRDAAVEAGISDEMLTLALEPEAASLQCKNDLGVQGVPVGCRYIVLDLGGGTADITCHEVQRDKTLRELHQPTGGDFGGTNVDNRFIDILNRIFGTDVMLKFKRGHMQEYWEFMSDFEIKKKKFDGTNRLILKFPTTMVKLYEEKTECSLNDSMGQSSVQGKIEFKLGKMFIKPELGLILFADAAKRVADASQELLDKISNIDHIIMVGGFSESPYLQKVMREKFQNLIIIPDEPAGAVLKGAVVYGHETTAIASRKCRYTYGIARMVTFKGPGEGHPLKKKTVIDGREYCDDIFNKHIEVGTELSVETRDQAEEHEYFPPQTDIRHAVLEVYASRKKNPKFTTDDGCFLVGLRKIDIDPQGDIWSKIMVKMMFGGTELEIQVREVNTNTVTVAKVDFLG